MRRCLALDMQKYFHQKNFNSHLKERLRPNRIPLYEITLRSSYGWQCLKWLYNDQTLCLDRKYQKFLKIQSVIRDCMSSTAQKHLGDAEASKPFEESSSLS